MYRSPLVTRALLPVAMALALVVTLAAAPAEAAVRRSPGLAASQSKDPAQVRLSFSRVAGGFDRPVFVTAAADGTRRLFVVESPGRIRVSTLGKVQARSYLDIRSRVNNAGGEQGLLGLAFDPRFSKTHRFWVAYTIGSGALRISRFTASSTKAPTVNPRTERVLLTIPHPGEVNHNSGMLAFGKDGMLYISTGDGGGGGDPFANAQNRRSLSGKILRINPHKSCGSNFYCIPASNPYARSSAYKHQIWAYGVRNVWRFSVDRGTGDLWLADVGQSRYEEVTRVPAGKAGRNLGWSCREGRHVFNASRCHSGTTYWDPTIEYSHSSGQAVTGGYVYRGRAYASLLRGVYIYSDFYSGHVWAYGKGERALVASKAGISGFGENDGGELLAVTYDGDLFKIRARHA